ncbi:Glutaredoxin-like protein, partial [mine drainage metagenome]
MTLISEEYRKLLNEEFSKILVNDVKLTVFVKADGDCKYCNETVVLIQELAELSSKIKYEIVKEKDPMVAKYGIEKYPAIIITGNGIDDSRVRYYGIPSGYEFSSLIEDIESVSKVDKEIDQKVADKIFTVNKPMKIQVFVTPTCPYCAKAVKTAHKFAMINPNIIGEMIEAQEFPDDA